MFVIIFLESSFFFLLPGDSLLFTAGIIATRGFLNVWMLIPLFFVATLTGSMFGYAIGERIAYLNRFRTFRRFVSEKHLNDVHAFFEKYGMVSLIFSRFIPIVRTFAPVGAGIGRMKYADFIKYNIIGSFLWSAVVTLLGFYLGRTFPGIQRYLSLMVVVVVAVSVLPGFVHLFFSRRNRLKRSQTR